MLHYIPLLANVSLTRHTLLSTLSEQRPSKFFTMFITKRLMLIFLSIRKTSGFGSSDVQEQKVVAINGGEGHLSLYCSVHLPNNICI